MTLPFRCESWIPRALDRPHVQAVGVLQRDLHPLLFRRIAGNLTAVDQDHRNAIGVILPGLLLAVDVLLDEVVGKFFLELLKKGLGFVAKGAIGLGVDDHIGCGGASFPGPQHSGVLWGWLRRGKGSAGGRPAASDSAERSGRLAATLNTQ